MSDIRKLMEAYNTMVSEKVQVELVESHFKVGDEVKCKASGMEGEVVAVDPSEKGKYYTVKREDGKTMKYAPDELELEDEKEEMDEAKKLDPVDDAENDKPFAKRKDKDIDNDGDVDSSDEYLHKRRAATDDAIDGGKKPADNADDKKKKDKNPRTNDKTAEISKIESVNTKESFDALWTAIEEAINQKKGATEPEKIDSKESPKSKEFIAKHSVDVKTHDELEKIEEPKERKVKKEMKEYEVIRALLSGKPLDGE